MSKTPNEIKRFDNAFYTYVNVLCERITDAESKLVERDPMSGCLYWRVKGKLPEGEFDGFYATPFWENEDAIPVAFLNDGGEFVAGETIPFAIEDLTMIRNTDAIRYTDVIRKFIKEKCNIVIPPEIDLTDL